VPRCRLAMAVVLWLTGTTVSHAQLRVLPPSPPGPPRSSGVARNRIIVSGSFGNGYFGRPVLVPATGYYPYGMMEPSFGVHVVAPIAPPLLPPPLDLSGVDLDVVPPPWAKDRPKREPELVALPRPDAIPKPIEPAKNQGGQTPDRLPRRDEMAKRVEPAKNEAGQPPIRPPPPDPLLPKDDPIEEGKRLARLGEAAFRGQEYGLAARKFSQALEVDPASGRAYFLLGQAYFALGKYRDAVQTIGLGLGLDPLWPKSPFRPRFELYGDHPEDWQRHLELLEDTLAQQPNNAGYLFLLAYLRWFDDERLEAARLFREVRPRVADPALVDQFLKATP
jgi:hypothetical protein